MSSAFSTFESAIQDAEALLAHFDAVNAQPPPDNAEVLKRAGLIMALTAWETYVEDCAREKLKTHLNDVDECQPLAKLVVARLDADLKRFHNPNSDRTRQLFLDYLGVDVTEFWKWNGFDSERVKRTLDELIAKRGDAVHRSKPRGKGAALPHLVKREDLAKAIRFVKHLVSATEKALFTE